jgi:hypothetical protein
MEKAFVFGSMGARNGVTAYPRPTDLPNPYRLVNDWPTLPATMNGGHWGEVIRVSIDGDGNIWVFHRCLAVLPPGSAVCLGANTADHRPRLGLLPGDCTGIGPELICFGAGGSLGAKAFCSSSMVIFRTVAI